METKTYRCDLSGCEIVKQYANGWYRAWRLPGGEIILLPWDTPVGAWALKDEDAAHLCGKGHAVQWVNGKL